jgi:putative phosphoesterase
MARIGLISDTHGLLRPEAIDALRGCDHIVHGGDIGDRVLLDALANLAPVTAVRGNNDTAAWAATLPDATRLQCEGVTLYVLHDAKQLRIDPHAEGIDVVVSGHSHRPVIATRDGVLYVNPGSAGPRRFRLPVTLALLDIVDARATARLVPLLPEPMLSRPPLS